MADVLELRASDKHRPKRLSAMSSAAESFGLEQHQSGWGDHYVGTAEQLVAAGLVSADQIPGALGKNKFTCTFIDGVPIKRGANYKRDERYLSVRRLGKLKFEVVKGVSNSTNEARNAARRAKARDDFDAKLREASAKATIHDFREFCLRHAGGAWALNGGDGLYPFRFREEARKRIDALNRQIETLILTEQVLRIGAPAQRPSLRLVPSA
jgi:hypothetical protein